MSFDVSGLGTGGGAGIGSGGYQSSATAKAAADVQAAIRGETGAGNRGFQNIVAFPGATVTSDAGINPPLTAKLATPMFWILGIVAVLALLAYWRKRA